MPDQQPISINEQKDDWEGLQRTLNYMFKDIYSLLDVIQGRANKTFEPGSIVLPDVPDIVYSVHNHENDAQGGKIDHGSALDGLDDPDHNAAYFAETEFLNASAGAGDSGKPIKLDATGKIDSTMLSAAVGDVLGPGASTDNAIARFHGATGKIIQNSLVKINDAGGIVIPDGQTIGSASTPTSVVIEADGDWYFYDKIGIGITPLYHLHIRSASSPKVYLEDSTNNVHVQTEAGNTEGSIGTTSAHAFNILTGNNKRIRIASDGTVEIGDAANYTQIAADGEITLAGTARVKRHVRIAAPSWKVGASAPTPGFLSVWPILSFDTAAADDEAHYSLICPHRMAAGTAIQVVVDWCHQAGADNGTVKWVLEYRVIEPGEDVTGATTEINATSPGNHAQHDLVRTQLGTTGITGAVAHDVIGLRLYRNVAGDTLAVDGDMIQVHFEFIMDKLGAAT